LHPSDITLAVARVVLPEVVALFEQEEHAGEHEVGAVAEEWRDAIRAVAYTSAFFILG
jgi:predicted nucleic acid-binding protein